MEGSSEQEAPSESLAESSDLTPLTPQMSSVLEKKMTVRRMLPKPKKAEAPKYVPKLDVYPKNYCNSGLFPKKKEERDDDEIM